MPRRVAICLAVLIAGAQWLGAASVQNSTTPVARPVVAAGGYLYVSTLRPASGVADDIGAQTQSVLAQLKTALEATGSSLGQLCSVTVTLRRAADFAAMNQAYAAVFLPATPEGPAPPTRTTVVGILPSRTLIEVSAIALPNGARREARRRDRKIKDGEVVPACGAAGPADAIVFGDMNDPESRVNQLKKTERNYGLLEDLNTRPRTTYLAALRNPNPELETAPAARTTHD